MQNQNVSFKLLKNTKGNKMYSIKIDKHDEYLTIYILDSKTEKLIRCLRIKKSWLLKEIISSMT